MSRYLGFLIPVFLLPWQVLADAHADLARAAKSPYDIARFVDTHADFDWTPLWKALGIDENSVLLHGCADGNCADELIAVVDPPQVIVLLRDGIGSNEEVYLRFRRPGGLERPGPWTFAGYYSNTVTQVHPEHELIRFGAKPYLLITGEQHQDGVGWRGLQESWFDLTTAKLEPVFCHLAELTDSEPGRVWLHSRAYVLSLESKPVERIKVNYDVDFRYPFPAGDGYLGSFSAAAVYTRRGSGFVFDPTLSEKPEPEIDKLCEFGPSDGPSNDYVLRYILPELKKMATSTDGDRKNWLKGFLKECKDTPEKRAIQALLRR